MEIRSFLPTNGKPVSPQRILVGFKWIISISATALILGCNQPSSDGSEISNSETGNPTQEITEGLKVESDDPVIVSELKAVPIAGKNIDTSGSIKSRLSFEEKIVTVNKQYLLDNFATARRVVPTQWGDLPSYSTEYLAQFSPLRKQHRVDPPLPPATDLFLEARWWAIFDFNGDNISDWVGLRIDNNNPSVMSLVCICTIAQTNGNIILHVLIATPTAESQTAALLPGQRQN